MFVDIIICVLFVGREQSLSCDIFFCPRPLLFYLQYNYIKLN